MKKVKIFMMVVMLAVSSLASAQTANDYVQSFTKMLDKYCMEFYSEDFPGRYYQERTLSITSVNSDPLTGEFSLKGTHSYKGKQLSVHTNVDWEATIEPLGNRKYRVKFDKYYEPDKIGPIVIKEGHWEYGKTRDYEYPKRR